MKCFAVSLFALCVITLYPEIKCGSIAAKCLQEELKKFGTQWQQNNNYTIEDGISIPSYQDVYEGYGIKISFITGEMKLAGAEDFTVEEVSVAPNKSAASISVSYPALTLSSNNYSLKGRAYSIYSLTGAGVMNITFENISGFVNANFVPKGTGSEISFMDFDFNIKNIKIYLQDSSWPINKVLNSQALKIVDGYREDIISLVNSNMRQFLDEFLDTTSTEEALTIMDTGNCLQNRHTVTIL